ncbi:hypothetical protein [Streptomyces sp. SID8014]|uniref:hypothetical protein n=1 Tax=Streptomyces sp. SID8014 TaxID=2706097 RepID=UPI001EF2D118|nr:hypothetical protein [Streptomyces sp. SID8014]
MPLPGSGYHTAPVAGDFDGDGRPELALSGGGRWWITDGTRGGGAAFPWTGHED